MDQVAYKLMIFFRLLKNIFMKGLFVIVFLGSTVVHAVETVYWVDNQSGVAMAGYDPISYFLRGDGDYGDYHYEYFWSGAVWRFQNEGNLVAFREYPLIYAPQFGGYDALRMSSSVRVSPDPHYSDVYGNRLYLFHNQKNLDIWSENRNKYIRASQKSWQSMHVYEVFKNFDVRSNEIEEVVVVSEPDREKQKVLKKMSDLDRAKMQAPLRDGLDEEDWKEESDQQK